MYSHITSKIPSALGKHKAVAVAFCFAFLLAVTGAREVFASGPYIDSGGLIQGFNQMFTTSSSSDTFTQSYYGVSPDTSNVCTTQAGSQYQYHTGALGYFYNGQNPDFEFSHCTGAGMPVNGDYWFTIRDISFNITYQFSLTRTGGTYPNGVWTTSNLPPVVSTTTRFTSLVPAQNQLIATTSENEATTTTAISGYVWSGDLSSSTIVRVSYLSDGGASSGFALDAVTNKYSFTQDYPITTAGDFTVGTSTSFPFVGIWHQNAQIINQTSSWCALGFCLFGNNQQVVATSSSFCVGLTASSTCWFNGIDNAHQEIISTIDTFVGSTTATVADVCSFSHFSVGPCLLAVFVPSSTQLGQDFNAIKVIPPWGYAFRVYDIFVGTATTSLPVIDYTFASTSVFAFIGNVHFDPFGTLSQSNSPVFYKSDHNGSNVWDIFNNVVRIIVYLTLAFMIINDLTHIDGADISSTVNSGIRHKLAIRRMVRRDAKYSKFKKK